MLLSLLPQTSHWHTIFASVEEEYHPAHHYTLRDLILFHVLDNPDIVNEICHKAVKEAELRQSVSKLKERWENKLLQTHQVPLEQYQFAVSDVDSSGQQASHKPGEKIVFLSPITAPQVSQAPANHLLTVSNSRELCALVEEDLVLLQVLLSSPHLGSLKIQAELWMSTLRQLMEVFSLLSSSQEKASVTEEDNILC